jgi:hypothetical protein
LRIDPPAREALWVLRAFWAHDAAAEPDLANVGQLYAAAFAADVMGIHASLTEQPFIAGCD